MELSRLPDVVGTTAGSPTREHNVLAVQAGDWATACGWQAHPSIEKPEPFRCRLRHPLGFVTDGTPYDRRQARPEFAVRQPETCR